MGFFALLTSNPIIGELPTSEIAALSAAFDTFATRIDDADRGFCVYCMNQFEASRELHKQNHIFMTRLLGSKRRKQAARRLLDSSAAVATVAANDDDDNRRQRRRRDNDTKFSR